MRNITLSIAHTRSFAVVRSLIIGHVLRVLLVATAAAIIPLCRNCGGVRVFGDDRGKRLFLRCDIDWI